ncbi:hypothetical protein C0991_012070 [Blastosporella zonata]|nr:hypothetical protein C0991_012070 [Blastosporella zonata]
MLFLRGVPGPFPVGATTFVTRVPSPHQVGSIKLRSNQKPALFLDEVAFTAFYPADTSGSTKKGLDWVIRPLNESLHGFAKFTGIPSWVLWPVFYLFGRLIKIPAYPNAPLAHPPQLLNNGTEKKFNQWPLVIFSHGLGGSRTAYSQICTQLASSGRVVLAMEHRDGTGCTCLTRVHGHDGGFREKPMYYYKDYDVIVDTDNSSEDTTSLPLRTDQLEFRREEIYTVYQSFGHFLKNDCASELETIDKTPINQTSWAFVDPISGKGPVCFDENVTLAGHSFGGCTVLSILSSNPPQQYLHIPITHVLILDPWLEPLPFPGPVPISQSPAELVAQSTPATELALDRTESGRDSRLPQMLVINSETFTLWKDHYARLESVVKAWEPEGGRLLTLGTVQKFLLKCLYIPTEKYPILTVSSKHEAFSDFPSLPVIRSSSAKTLTDILSKLSIAFLDGNLEEALGSTSTRKMEIKIVGKKKDGKPRRKLIGSAGDVIVS